MNMKLVGKFAIKNLKANRYIEVPFIIAAGIMLILFNIMASLMQNEYVLTRHKELPTFINMGIGVVFIFTFVFVVYANRFLIKRRNKEFALYGILGLEKKHIRKIILIEHIINYSLVAVIAISGGYVFGKLAFMGLNSLMKDTAVKIMDYPFSTQATAITLVYVLFLFVFVYLLNALSIKNASPVELLGREHRGEGEPKNRLVLLLIGLAFLVVGYYIALTINGILKSLLAFFIAVVLVIIATYILFITFSIFMLKIQKKNKNFYYKAKNFLSVSGMIYRMKSSAVGIASVNDRSLITDNNAGALTLGTGGILTRYDYLVTLNGDSIINDKSITNSETTLYWYDLDKNVICSLSNDFNELSKVKQV